MKYLISFTCLNVLSRPQCLPLVWYYSHVLVSADTPLLSPHVFHLCPISCMCFHSARPPWWGETLCPLASFPVQLCLFHFFLVIVSSVDAFVKVGYKRKIYAIQKVFVLLYGVCMFSACVCVHRNHTCHRVSLSHRPWTCKLCCLTRRMNVRVNGCLSLCVDLWWTGELSRS